MITFKKAWKTNEKLKILLRIILIVLIVLLFIAQAAAISLILMKSIKNETELNKINTILEENRKDIKIIKNDTSNIWSIESSINTIESNLDEIYYKARIW